MTQSTDDILAALAQYMEQLERRADAAEQARHVEGRAASDAIEDLQAQLGETRAALAAMERTAYDTIAREWQRVLTWLIEDTRERLANVAEPNPAFYTGKLSALTYLFDLAEKDKLHTRVSPTELEQVRAQLEETRADNARLCALVGVSTPIAAFDLATTWRASKAHYMEHIAELEAQIEQARQILSALENETLVEAATDLAREEQTTNEAYHKMHALYWKEAMPELETLRTLARALVESTRGDGNGRCWCGAREADQLRGYLERNDHA